MYLYICVCMYMYIYIFNVLYVYVCTYTYMYMWIDLLLSGTSGPTHFKELQLPLADHQRSPEAHVAVGAEAVEFWV